jgi:hypothetical protein
LSGACVNLLPNCSLSHHQPGNSSIGFFSEQKAAAPSYEQQIPHPPGKAAGFGMTAQVVFVMGAAIA